MKSLFYLLPIILFISCNPSATPTLELEMDEIFTAQFPEGEPGAALLVKKGGNVLFQKSYGLADLESKEKITEHTVFNTGSISKTFVAYGILILNQEGKLSLENSLSLYFDDFKYPEIADKVKIKHLLSHTSGLPDSRNVSENRDFFMTAKDEENFEPLKATDSLNFEPGEQYEYSNPAFNGLVLIIEKVSGQKWQDFIVERIFQPAGMTDSKITDGPYPEKEVAHGYEKEEEEYVESDYGEFPTFPASGNGGVWSSVNELAKYEEAIQQGLFLNEDLIRLSRTVFQPENWKDDTPPFLGFSWFTGEKSLFGQQSELGVDMVYHTGSQGGFRAFHVYLPDSDVLYIGLFNRPPDDFDALILQGLDLFRKYEVIE